MAKRASKIASIMPKTEQIGWLRTLYKRRNDALHAGRFHQDDLDAMKLLALVDLVIHGMISHLDPWHRGANGRPCTTIEQALETHED